MAADVWSPDRYARFRDERSKPFFDLLALVKPRPAMRVVDLGCGTGELTQAMHRQLGASDTLGLDNSDAMLAGSAQFAGEGLRFERGDLAAFEPAESYDLVFSNAAIQWVSGHLDLLCRLTRALKPSGQLAIQMPMQDEHASHRTAHQVAAESPFRENLGGFIRREPLLLAEEYAGLLDRLGYSEQNVRVQIYGHHLPTRDDVIEWVKGTLLTDYQKRLGAALFERFLLRYRELLMERLEDRRPFFYTYKRILIWGLRP